MTVNDLVRVTQMLIAAGGQDHDVRALRIDGEPVAKARARAGRYGHFTPTRTVDAEATIASYFRSDKPTVYVGNIALAVVFFRSNRGRIDVDNLMKTVLDGITKSESVWEDDDQVTALVGVLEYDPDYPRTAVAIGHHTSTMLRGDARLTHTCETCGKKYRPHGTPKVSKYCSRECRTIRPALQICVDCGGPTSAPHVERCTNCYAVHRTAGAAS